MSNGLRVIIPTWRAVFITSNIFSIKNIGLQTEELTAVVELLWTAVYCGPVPGITNGFVKKITSVYLGGVVSYGCFKSFGLAGGTTSRCEGSGQWSHPPNCTGRCLLKSRNKSRNKSHNACIISHVLSSM